MPTGTPTFEMDARRACEAADVTMVIAAFEEGREVPVDEAAIHAALKPAGISFSFEIANGRAKPAGVTYSHRDRNEGQ